MFKTLPFTELASHIGMTSGFGFPFLGGELEEGGEGKCHIRLELTYSMLAGAWNSDLMTMPPPSRPPPPPCSSPSSFSSSPNLQPTFSSCAAAAGKVAGALSQALAFNAARAPLRHKEEWVGLRMLF